MKQDDLVMKSAAVLKNEKGSSETSKEAEAGLVKLKIDAEVFQILKRKRRAGETIRMALERAIMTF